MTGSYIYSHSSIYSLTDGNWSLPPAGIMRSDITKKQSSVFPIEYKNSEYLIFNQLFSITFPRIEILLMKKMSTYSQSTAAVLHKIHMCYTII
jgi:hypothetical protein